MIYEEAAKEYKPDKIKYLFIAEAPPKKKEGQELRYFYFDKVAIYDYLIQNIVETLFSEEYKRSDKRCWLNKLKEEGFFLIDAIEKPIKSGLSNKVIAGYINDNFPNLLQKLKNLTDKDTKIILIKKVVFNELDKKLKTYGFNVINTEMLDFPSSSRQPQFREKFKKLIIKEEILFPK